MVEPQVIQLGAGPKTEPHDGSEVHLTWCWTQNGGQGWKHSSILDPERRLKMELQFIGLGAGPRTKPNNGSADHLSW